MQYFSPPYHVYRPGSPLLVWLHNFAYNRRFQTTETKIWNQFCQRFHISIRDINCYQRLDPQVQCSIPEDQISGREFKSQSSPQDEIWDLWQRLLVIIYTEPPNIPPKLLSRTSKELIARSAFLLTSVSTSSWHDQRGMWSHHSPSCSVVLVRKNPTSFFGDNWVERLGWKTHALLADATT
jgi:hypothetical protein